MIRDTIAIQDGQFLPYHQISVSAEDRAVYFGDGIYEVVRLYGGRFDALHEHMDRLYRSAEHISLTDLPDRNDLRAMLEELVRRNQLSEDGMLYVQFSRGIAPRVHRFPGEAVPASWFAYIHPLKRPVDIMYQGESAVLVQDIRWLRCDIKSLNLLPNVLASEEAAKAGCREAILYRDESHVTEGASSNVFIVKDGVLRTHPANHLILNGITRQRVIQLAEELGVRVEEQVFGVSELLEADEVFRTSTICEICPVTAIGDHIIGHGVPGAITRRLQEAFERVVTAGRAAV